MFEIVTVVNNAYQCHGFVAALVRADRTELGEALDSIVPPGVSQTSPVAGATLFRAPRGSFVNLLAPEARDFRRLLTDRSAVVAAVQFQRPASVRVLPEWDLTSAFPRWFLDNVKWAAPAAVHGVTPEELGWLYPYGVPVEA